MGWFSNFHDQLLNSSILHQRHDELLVGVVAGGPLVITFGWLIVGFFVLMVGMAMPDSGASTTALAKKERPGVVLVGRRLVGPPRPDRCGSRVSTTRCRSSSASSSSCMRRTSTSRSDRSSSSTSVCHHPRAHQRLRRAGDPAAGDISVWWHVVGVAIIFVVLIPCPSNREGFRLIFTNKNLTGWTGGAFITFYTSSSGSSYRSTRSRMRHVSAQASAKRPSAPAGAARSRSSRAIHRVSNRRPSS